MNPHERALLRNDRALPRRERRIGDDNVRAATAVELELEPAWTTAAIASGVFDERAIGYAGTTCVFLVFSTTASVRSAVMTSATITAGRSR